MDARKKILAIDIDETITKGYVEPAWNYEYKQPDIEAIKRVNKLYEKYIIVLFTGRDQVDEHITRKWLNANGVKFHSIIFGKPKYDYFIDDKAFNTFKEFEREVHGKV